MGSNPPPISEAELDVLKVLWKQGPGTVREINTQLKRKKRRWAYNTVLTLLTRLKEKGYVTSKKQGVAYVFHSVVSREKLLGQSLTELANRVCDGTASPFHGTRQDRLVESVHQLLLGIVIGPLVETVESRSG